MLDDLMAACDADGNDGIDYNEFIDKLARDTVAPGAMGKRGMQSKDAMGEDAFEMLNEQVCMQSNHAHKKARINHSLTQHAMRASPPLSLHCLQLGHKKIKNIHMSDVMRSDATDSGDAGLGLKGLTREQTQTLLKEKGACGNGEKPTFFSCPLDSLALSLSHTLSLASFPPLSLSLATHAQAWTRRPRT